jgi:asparaginyl-tRNA synthetase
MDRVRSVREVLGTDPESAGEVVKVNGWVRTRRDSKAGVSFIELNDGSCFKNLQIVADHSRPDGQSMLAGVSNGCSLTVEGTIERSPGKGQSVEVHATRMEVVGPADPATYPLQKKRHSFEFLREIAHLRPRTNTIGAAMRVRNRISFAIHEFLEERGFLYIHTPIITASDCEGAGDVFRVTTLDPCRNVVASEPGGPSQDFFGRPTFLTVSGQLQAEIYALALGKVYTFGPTFRAENSNTSRHLAEFWMVEPEMAFCDLQGDLELAEGLVKHLVQAVLNRCDEDIEFFTRFMEADLRHTLEQTVREPFEVISYTEAVELLNKSGETFSFPVAWGNDLQAEHERCLTERVFRKPVAILNFPRALKPFYMRVNEDERTVAAMDVLVPRIGEIIGGSQREERRDMLLEQMQARSVPVEEYRWYVELREWGTVPHAGFGLGLERMVQYCTGIANIREVIPFPRTPGHAEF